MDACIVWPKAKNNHGYGVRWFQGKVHLAHRVAWFLEYGAWPRAGLVLDHICDNKPRVNVTHLRECTNGENVGRSPSCAFNLHRRATHCRNGHAYDETTSRDRRGHRICSHCPSNRFRRAES